MQPAWHPSGQQLAWVEWDHPNMPWDGTELRLGKLTFPADGPPALESAETIAGGREAATYGPVFTRDGQGLIYACDEPGWWHLFRRDLAAGVTTQLTNGEAEFAEPAWQQGMRRYAVTASGRIVAIRNKDGFNTLVSIGPDGELRDESARHEGYTALAYPAASGA